MIFNLLVIAIVLFIAYMWASQGLFSAMIHFICTLVAGAIAFGVWELLASRFLLGVKEELAWSVSLAGPFLLSLVALRIASDKLVTANMKFSDTVNLIGGGVFGLGSGVISVGVLIIAIGFLPLPADFLGHRAMIEDDRGNFTESGGLWLPADKLTATIYETLSQTGFATSTPLATRHPHLHQQASLVRATFDNAGRVAYSRDDFDVVGRYRVEGAKDELLTDSVALDESGRPFPPQQARDLQGRPLPEGSFILGYLLQFESGARESTSQVVVGAGQIRLVGTVNGAPYAAQPLAVVSRSRGEELTLGRWRFDGKEVFAASRGAQTPVTMAFEFLVPPGFQPLDILVKNVRVSASDIPYTSGGPDDPLTVVKRDDLIRSRGLLGESGATSGFAQATEDTQRVGGDFTAARDAGVIASSRIPYTFNKSVRGALTLDDENQITGGTQKLTKEQLSSSPSSALRVDSLAAPFGQTLIQVNVSLDSAFSLFGRSVQTAQNVLPPFLIDDLGQRYQAIGYLFDEGRYVEIRFTPGRAVRALSEIPKLTRSKPDQKLTLVFAITRGVNITQFALGNKVLVEIDPPLQTR